MREIKFRAWDSNYAKMVTDGDDLLNWTSLLANDDGILKIEMAYGAVLMQYTGLKDKNGKEIYEGDILASGRFTEGVVEYDECGGGGPDEGFRTMGFYVSTKYDDEKGLLDITPLEVIGNIYENPELLDAKA